MPVVAVLVEAGEESGEQETEMALPTLIGNDGRKAVIAFTGIETSRAGARTPARSRSPPPGSGPP